MFNFLSKLCKIYKIYVNLTQICVNNPKHVWLYKIAEVFIDFLEDELFSLIILNQVYIILYNFSQIICK